MKTAVYHLDPGKPAAELVQEKAIQEAAAILQRGGLVAFPTETVYGLGADATNPRAVAGIFLAKGRPADNPLIVHIATWEDFLALAAEVPPQAADLAELFWPGPLTMVVRRSPKIPDAVTAGLETVGIRMPAHPVALAMLRVAGVPVAAPSANRSGSPSPTRGEDVLVDLDGRIDLLLDAGPTGVGLESTVLDLTTPVPTILRPGGVTREELGRVLPQVQLDPGLTGQEKPRSPGMKYRHYAPRAELLLVEGDNVEALARRVKELARQKKQAGLRVGIMATAETLPLYQELEEEGILLRVVGERKDLRTVAARLFALLREMDRLQCHTILAEAVPEKGIGLAIMNRLRKAAGGKVVHA